VGRWQLIFTLGFILPRNDRIVNINSVGCPVKGKVIPHGGRGYHLLIVQLIFEEEFLMSLGLTTKDENDR
jgi:hypothetical protein